MAQAKHNIILGLDAREFRSQLSGIQSSLSRMQGIFAAVIAGQGVLAFSKLGAQVNNVRNAFDKLGDPGLIADLRGATKGMISDLELMQQTVKFNNFNLPLDQLATFLKFVSVRAAETGDSLDYLSDSLVEGLSKESLLRLDNLGISAKRMKEELDKGSSYAQALADIIKEELGGDIAADRTQQLVTTFQNLRDELSVKLLPVINQFFGKMNAGMTQLTYFKDNLKLLAGAYKSVSDEGMIALARAKDYELPGVAQAIDDYTSAVRRGAGVGDEASTKFYRTIKSLAGAGFDLQEFLRLQEAIWRMYGNTALETVVTNTKLKKSWEDMTEEERQAYHEMLHTARVTKEAKEAFDNLITTVRGYSGALTMIDLEEMENELLRMEEPLETFKEKVKDIDDQAAHLASAFQQVGMSIVSSFKLGESAAGSFFGQILNMILELISAQLSASIANAITGATGAAAFAGPFAPVALPVTIASMVGTVISAFGSLTRMAHGGIVDQPTPLLAGEAGPEAIIPLHKLNGMTGGNLSARISGRDLLLLLERESSAKSRLYG